MMYVVSSMTGATRLTFMDDLYKGATVMLFGGAPTIKELPLELLQQRGVVTAAINNVARHFRPTLWFSGDNPACYDLNILQDPGIMKFSPNYFMDVDVEGVAFKFYPNTVFFVPDRSVAQNEMLISRKHTAYYNNTLMAAIVILYSMGFRRIILCGCDFEMTDGQLYAHKTRLTPEEINSNLRLYDSQVQTLIAMKPATVEAGLCIMDASVKSKLGSHYERLSFTQAVDMCTGDMTRPGMSEGLMHGTRFASEEMRKAIGVYSAPPKDVI